MSTYKKVTMQDIAFHAGVSQPTVSLVLNGQNSARISEETKAKVIAIAEELGYKKTVSQTLALHGRNLKIAMIIDGAFVTNDHFISAIEGASEQAHKLEIQLNIITHPFDMNDNQKHDDNYIYENLQTFDGVIVATTTTRDLMSNFTHHDKIVYLNCLPTQNNNITAILPDDFNSSFNLALLVANKYKKPAIIAGDQWMKATMERTRAIVQCYRNQGITIDDSNIYYTNWSFKQSYDAVNEILQKDKKDRPDILFCGSDFLANAAYLAIYKNGLSIPDDIAVVGFDNQIISKELTPALTTVTLPYEQMGIQAVDAIYHMLHNHQNNHQAPLNSLGQVSRLVGDVIVRSSTKLA